MGKMAAQAQVVREEEITAQESLELVKCLLRVSVYHVTFLRNLFPERHFRGVDMKNLDQMHIKMLDDACGDPEVEMLVEWVENGVVDALKRRYLKRMYFGVALDPEAKVLLEEYVFSFSYDEAGHAAFSVGAHGKRFNSQAGSVKYQVCRLMRMLVQICQTLEEVPDERFLFMKLTYNEHCPTDYEPPHFREAGDSAVATFSRQPFQMEVGRVGTKHHQVSLHVKSVLDSVVAQGEEQMVEDNSLLMQEQITTVPQAAFPRSPRSEAGGSCAGKAVSQDLSAAQGRLPGGDDDDVSSGGCFSRAGPRGTSGAMHWRQRALAPETLYTQPQDELLDCSPASVSQQEELAALRAWALKRSTVHMLDAMSCFGNISSSRLEACVRQLERERVLLPTDEPERFKVFKHGTHALPAAAAAECELALQQLTVAEQTAASGAARHKQQAASPGGLPPTSEQGGVWDAVGGTQKTQSVLGALRGGAGRGAASPGSQVPAGLYMDGTQPSRAGGGAGGGRPKQSIAKQLIKQTGKRQRDDGAGVAGRGGEEEQGKAAPAPKPKTRMRTRRG